MQSVEERLASLEKQNRRLKTAGFLVLGLFGSAILWACPMKTQEPGNLTAQEFRLVDASGKTRGGLSIGAEGPYLSLLDSNGKERILMGLANNLPHLTLKDANESGRIQLGIVPDSSGLMLYDSKGEPRAQLDVGNAGPRLYLENQFGYQATVGNYLVLGNEELNQKLKAMTFTLSHSSLGPIWRAP
jgi:hypothetical protein